MKLTDKQRAFEREMLELGCTLAMFHRMEKGDTPKRLAERLRNAERAATAALQALLALEHRPGQDVEAEPYDWTLAQSIARGLWLHRQRQGREVGALDGYPAPLIDALREFRGACAVALELEAPKRGNAVARTARVKLVDMVGKNFVRCYRCAFEALPPVSQTGWAVSVLQKMLDEAGATDANAASVLRRHVEKQRRVHESDVAAKQPDCAK